MYLSVHGPACMISLGGFISPSSSSPLRTACSFYCLRADSIISILLSTNMGAIKLGQADSWSAIKMSNKIVIVPCITFFTLLLLIFTMQSSRDNVANLTWAATNQVVEMVTARDDLHDVKNDTLGVRSLRMLENCSTS